MESFCYPPYRENVRVKVLFPVRWKTCAISGDLADLIRCHRTSDRFCAPPPSFADLPADLTDLTDTIRDQKGICACA